MYFPIGWPKILNTKLDGQNIRKICCDRVKILFAILTDDILSIWYTKPCVPITYKKRSTECLLKNGPNKLVEWKPDSSMLVVATENGVIFLYTLGIVDPNRGVYNQTDSPFANLKRDSAELFVKETIPSLTLNMTIELSLGVQVTCITCVSVSQMMVGTETETILRMRWDGGEERDYTLDLRRIPFSINQQVSYAAPITEKNTYITNMEYSPLLAGFAVTLNDGRAAFLTANDLKFDPNQVQGIWVQNMDDATCTAINHKYRLLAFGRQNSQANVYLIDDLTGGLELSHSLTLSAKDFPGVPGYVREMKWSPDGCVLMLAWSNGGISLWSTFGTMLMCSLGWDYGLHVDLNKNIPLNIICMDWSTEGYQLLMVREIQKVLVSSEAECVGEASNMTKSTMLVQMDFLKSVLTVNPCMSFFPYLLLQGDDKLYLNHGDALQKVYNDSQTNKNEKIDNFSTSDMRKHFESYEVGKSLEVSNILSESKHWTIFNLPIAYSGTNWPIRYSAIDSAGANIAVAGRTGIALYSLATRKWKLFGNETQEKDFVVTGGLLWWEDFIIMGSYSLIEHHDEIRMYPRNFKLDNRFSKIILMPSAVMLINVFKDQLIVFTADSLITRFAIVKHDAQNIDLLKLQTYDIKNLCIHPACVVLVLMTNLKHENVTRINQVNSMQSETMVLNVSGRVLMVQTENIINTSAQLVSTCLASSVECIWVSNSKKTHLKESLWLYCGGHGMRVWLPVFPREDSGVRSHRHTFMSKRIMLSFLLKIYPLAILFEDAIILGAENDTTLYTSDPTVHFSLPYCALERTSQVYLHQILRQLIRRNLGYNAWEIARCCVNLPYFPHTLELLLHEVLEEEATSKEPIPDALLPSVLEFIQEFPVYLQTVVQCARKTEIALWPYLFATAGKPKELFQQCMSSKQLETAASYLIILQNLEPSSTSRQYATLLLDTALEEKNWDLAKDLVRFLRAIDPNDVESPRTSFVMGGKFGHSGLQSSTVSPNAEDLSLILGTMTRGRSFSTTINAAAKPQPDLQTTPTSSKDKYVANISEGSIQRRKKSVPSTTKEKQIASAEEFFIDVILQRHARQLLQSTKLQELGYMSAALDFHLVGWLGREKERAARIEDFVGVLKQLHEELNWPKPSIDTNFKRNTKKIVVPHESPSTSSQFNNKFETMDSGYASLPTTQNLKESSILLTNPDNENKNLASNAPSQYAESEKGAKFNDFDKPNTETEIILRSKSLTSKSCMMEERKSGAASEFYMPASMDAMSVCSEQVSMWAEDNNMNLFANETDSNYNTTIESLSSQNLRVIEHKLEIQIRYLLQIFTEANCLELALLLSILLLDVASVCRINNTAIRSKSLAMCRQLRNGLKDVTRWCFAECLGYRPFMLALQPQIQLLDKFVIQQESIPNIDPSLIQFNHSNIKDMPNFEKLPPLTSLKEDLLEQSDDNRTINKKLYKKHSSSTNDISIKNEATEVDETDLKLDNLSLKEMPQHNSSGCIVM